MNITEILAVRLSDICENADCRFNYLTQLLHLAGA